MSEGDSEDKTEQPTDRRRSQAREQGNVARSADLTAALLMVSGTGALWFNGPAFVATLRSMLEQSLAAPAWSEFDPRLVEQATWRQMESAFSASIPLLAAMFVASLAVNWGQVGFLWAPEVIQPNWERINPLSGMQRLFSLQSLVRLAGGLLKISILTVVSWIYLTSRQPAIRQAMHGGLDELSAFAGGAMIELGFWLSGSLAALAVFDYGYHWWQFEQDLRMSKQELREELKEMDGNPHVRARRKELHRKLAEARQLGDVRTADVVITNPTHIAVAIKYDAATMPAPIVVAKGMGEIAAQIRKIAAEHGIPIIERKPLARLLYRTVKRGKPIPVDLYGTFAEILKYVYSITGRGPLGERS